MANRSQVRRALHETFSSEVRISKEEQWVGTAALAAGERASAAPQAEKFSLTTSTGQIYKSSAKIPNALAATRAYWGQ
jgi:hypothetical protein